MLLLIDVIGQNYEWGPALKKQTAIMNVALTQVNLMLNGRHLFTKCT